MALPQSMVLTCLVAFLLVVLQMSAAPLESTSNKTDLTEASHEVNVTSVSTETTPTSIISTSLSHQALVASSLIPSYTTLSPTVTDIITSSSQLPQTDVTQFLSSADTVGTTENVFSSDEAIRHLPGYWIKRPSSSSTANPEDELDEHPGEAQESFIDYRTERYQIEDLFPITQAHTSNTEENVTALNPQRKNESFGTQNQQVKEAPV